MQLPWIKKVSITSGFLAIPEGGPIAEVEFAELLNPAQEEYLATVCKLYAGRLSIKLAMAIGGRVITFRRFGKQPIPTPEVMQKLLDGMDIGAVSSSPSTETKRKPPAAEARYTRRRSAITHAALTSFDTAVVA